MRLVDNIDPNITVWPTMASLAVSNQTFRNLMDQTWHSPFFLADKIDSEYLSEGTVIYTRNFFQSPIYARLEPVSYNMLQVLSGCFNAH